MKGWLLITKINYVVTNGHPSYIWNLNKEVFELETQKQDPVIDLATVNIKLVKAYIYALKSRFNTLKMKVDANLCEAFSDADRTSFKKLQFQVTDSCGYFSKLEHELTGLNNKYESVEGG